MHSNILMGVLAALFWGGGDFSGGMGAKRAGGSPQAALRVILISHTASLCILAALGKAEGGSFPHGAPLFWGLAAGVTGGLSLTGFYVALARGVVGAPAAISGLFAAAIPAIVSSILEGFPGLLRIAGFVMAGAAIWMVAASPGQTRVGSAHASASTLLLSAGAGAGFGLYFVLLRMASVAGVVWPMATARVGSISTCFLLLLVMSSGKPRTDQAGVPMVAVLWALSTAALDTAGNMFFLASARAGRLDIAAVLASLYPAPTILLAGWLLGERLNRQQQIGLATAATAIVMITI